MTLPNIDRIKINDGLTNIKKLYKKKAKYVIVKDDEDVPTVLPSTDYDKPDDDYIETIDKDVIEGKNSTNGLGDWLADRQDDIENFSKNTTGKVTDGIGKAAKSAYNGVRKGVVAAGKAILDFTGLNSPLLPIILLVVGVGITGGLISFLLVVLKILLN